MGYHMKTHIITWPCNNTIVKQSN